MTPLPISNSEGAAVHVTAPRPQESARKMLPQGARVIAPSSLRPHEPTRDLQLPKPTAENRRLHSSCAVTRLYPWLLTAATATAALFCAAYLTKPVLVAAPSTQQVPLVPVALETQPSDSKSSTSASQSSATTRAPSEIAKPIAAPPPLTKATSHEETNLKMQHIITAGEPGGELHRIILDVPVLYQSRSLRWTPEQVAQARAILSRLQDYQEASRHLRNEAAEILGAWNELVSQSIPSEALRADSPSLPHNQINALGATLAPSDETLNAIRINQQSH